MKNVTLSSLFKPFGNIFRTFHMTLFIVVLTAGLIYAVESFNTLLNNSSTDTTYTSPIDAGTIDQATLDRIKSLHTSDEARPTPTQPPGRINPFSE